MHSFLILSFLVLQHVHLNIFIPVAHLLHALFFGWPTLCYTHLLHALFLGCPTLCSIGHGWPNQQLQYGWARLS